MLDCIFRSNVCKCLGVWFLIILKKKNNFRKFCERSKKVDAKNYVFDFRTIGFDPPKKKTQLYSKQHTVKDLLTSWISIFTNRVKLIDSRVLKFTDATSIIRDLLDIYKFIIIFNFCITWLHWYIYTHHNASMLR